MPPHSKKHASNRRGTHKTQCSGPQQHPHTTTTAHTGSKHPTSASEANDEGHIIIMCILCLDLVHASHIVTLNNVHLRLYGRRCIIEIIFLSYMHACFACIQWCIEKVYSMQGNDGVHSIRL